nr:hypothetical protein [Myxococcota bacterium]
AADDTRAPAPRATARVDAIRGALTAEQLASAIPRGALDACDAGDGELPIRMRIARDGRATARARRGTIRDRAAILCITSALGAQRFPTTTGVTRATITVTTAR